MISPSARHLHADADNERARSAGRLVLVPRNGLRAPVSGTCRDQVKQAGWLD